MVVKKSLNNIKPKIRALIALCFLLIGKDLAAQSSTSSPYSRFGIGDLNSITYARNLSMGGTEIGLDQPGFINFGNPASYSALWYTTYEAAGDYKQYELKDAAVVHNTHTASFSYFDFAFPIKPQKWSLGFGLMPYSKVGYSISEKQESGFGDLQTTKYEGSGGLNNFHIGTGFKINKKLSAGINAEYLFGVFDNDRMITFRSPYYFNGELNSSTSVSWFHFKTGFQYHIDSIPFGKSDSIVMIENKLFWLEDSLARLVNNITADSSQEKYDQKNKFAQEIASLKLMKDNVVNKKIKSNWHLVLGLVFSPEVGLHARTSTLDHSFRFYNYALPDISLSRDTIVNTEGEKGEITLPMDLGFGFSLLKGNNWLICADFTTKQWSKFSFLGVQDSLVNSWKVSAGVQFTPNDRALKSYLKTIQYRLGFHYEKGFLKLNGRTINEIGFSQGFGLPIKKAGTIIHLTVEAGQRGTTKNELIQERFLKFTFGFTITDRWFVKSKLD